MPVDSKVPLDQYLDALAATSEADRNHHLKKHASALRERMDTLAAKNYAVQFPVSPDVTVLFLPSDAFLSAALEFDRSLLEDAMEKKIVIATPVSLFCLLKSVAYDWQQDAIAKNAQVISSLGKELYGRIATLFARPAAPRPARDSVRSAPAISWPPTPPAPNDRPGKLAYAFSSNAVSLDGDPEC